MFKGQIGLTATRPDTVLPPAVWLTGHTNSSSVTAGLALDVIAQHTTNGSPTQQWTYGGGNQPALDRHLFGWNYLQIVGVQKRSHPWKWPGLDGPMARLLTSGTRTNNNNQKLEYHADGQRLLFGGEREQRKIHGGFGRSGATQPGAAVDQWSGTQSTNNGRSRLRRLLEK